MTLGFANSVIWWLGPDLGLIDRSLRPGIDAAISSWTEFIAERVGAVAQEVALPFEVPPVLIADLLMALLIGSELRSHLSESASPRADLLVQLLAFGAQALDAVSQRP